jgi:hypothetical protein
MSVIIIIGGEGHKNIARIAVKSATGQLGKKQQESFQFLMEELAHLADEADPQ